MEEVWKTIVGFPMYQVSNLGRIKSLGNDRQRKEKILKFGKSTNGYLQVNVGQKSKNVHRIVALHFIENPNNFRTIDHIDSDKSNNRVDNLEWVTHRENSQRYWRKNKLNWTKKPDRQRNYSKIRKTIKNKDINWAKFVGRLANENKSIKIWCKENCFDRDRFTNVVQNYAKSKPEEIETINKYAEG